MNHVEPVIQSEEQSVAKDIVQQDFVLSEREAKAASPDFLAVCGEEDPGEGLEFLVTSDPEMHFQHS